MSYDDPDQPAEPAAVDTKSQREQLRERFRIEHHEILNGMIYIDQFAQTERANRVLGLDWHFEVFEVGQTQVETWARCLLTATIDGQTVRRGQVGCVPHNGQGGGPRPDAFKSAATDGLKKCFSLIGIGWYLHNKQTAQRMTAEYQAYLRENGIQAPQQQQSSTGAGYRQQTPQQHAQPPQQRSGYQQAPNGFNPNAGAAIACEQCGEPLTETRFKDNTAWSAEQLATFGRRKHNRALCMSHYREANQAKQVGQQPVPQQNGYQQAPAQQAVDQGSMAF